MVEPSPPEVAVLEEDVLDAEGAEEVEDLLGLDEEDLLFEWCLMATRGATMAAAIMIKAAMAERIITRRRDLEGFA
jgi:hypothetical protein